MMNLPSDPVAVMEAFQAAQNAGDIERCLALVTEDAIVDVGRGRFEGKEQVRRFIEMLARLHTRDSEPQLRPGGRGHLSAARTNTDEQLRRLGIAALRLQANFSVREGVIASLYARSTQESIALLRAARRRVSRTSGRLTPAGRAGRDARRRCVVSL